ncbi:unnamed protein product [Owenia fusiformis]|uniref:Titin n=1 Tax=Owenia fusiformis TaxID=6347 RepID=A0A8J1UJ60_OWEFU|nr:unnamed protein product [Owenia fusiformis]
MPKNLNVTDVSETQVSLKWEEPEHDGGSDIMHYIVESREAYKRSWQSVETTSERHSTAGRLNEGTQYVFRVAAENSVGVGEFNELTQSVTAKSKHGVPSPPSAPKVNDITSKSCSLSWEPPANDGGTPVIGYHIERRSTKSIHWIKVSRELVKTTTYEATELRKDTEYDFRIIAENKVGVSEPSQPSAKFVAKDPWDIPGPPGVPEISNVTNTTAHLTWTAPKNDGGSPIINYVVEFRAQGAFKWNKATEVNIVDCEYTVKKLKEDQMYEFRVSAENKAGVGAPAESSQAVKAKEIIKGDPPKIVRGIKDTTALCPDTVKLECNVNLGKPKAEIHWFKQAKEIYKGRKYDMEYANGTATLIINDTEPSDTAKYRCEAMNPIGKCDTTGSLTIHCEPIIDYEPSQESQNIKGGASLMLHANFEGIPTPTASWFFNDTPLEKSKSVVIDTSDTYTSITVRGMSKENAGKYKVVAENKVGVDEATFTVNVTDKPGAPVNLKVTEVTKETITVEWEAPEDNGGSEITGYAIEKRDAKRNTWAGVGNTKSNVHTFTVPKLVEGNSYYIRVFTENAIGASEPAETKDATIVKLPFNEPGPPRDLTANDINKNSATLTWKAPSSDGGAKIKGYIIEKRQAFSTRWVRVNRHLEKNTELYLDDLVNGEEYEFRVMAENEAGISQPAKTITFTAKPPFEKPGPPGRPEVSLTKGQAELAWSAPLDDGRSPIFNYRIEMKEAFSLSWTGVNPDKKCKNTSWTVENLKEDTEYEFRVTAENKAGFGQPSPSSATAKYEEVVEFTKKLEDVTLKTLPNDAVFECELSKANCEVQWFKDGEKLRPSKKYEIETNGKYQSLVVKDSQPEDVAEYMIIYKNKKCSATLDIVAPPTYTLDEKFKETIVLTVGSSMVVEIPFAGAPQPKVAWTLNGKSLAETKRVSTETIKNMTALTMSKVQKKDGGKYGLKLTNKIASVDITIKVQVLDKPSAPRDFEVTSVNETSIGLKWTEPSDDGGAKIIDYILENREGSRRSWNKVEKTTKTETKATHLTEGSQYVFRVAARNEVGVGEFMELSQSVTAKSPHGVPMPPGTPRVSDVLAKSCTLTWGPSPDDGGTPVIGYHIERRTGMSMRFTQISKELITDMTYQVKDLIEGSDYEFRIIAENKIGQSQPSEPCPQFRAKNPWDIPGRPGTPKVGEITNTSVSLTWGAPDDDGGAPITGYMVEYKSQTAFSWNAAHKDTIDERSFTVKDLKEDKLYDFRVMAVNKAGTGPPAATAQPVKAKEIIKGDPPKVITPLKETSVSAPKDATMTCEIDSGKPKADIRWFKDAKEVYKSRRHEMSYSAKTASLTIYDTEPSDAASYKCEASNPLGLVDTTARLIIQAAPKIDYELRLKEKQAIKAGNSLIISVNISALPPAKVTWSVNGKELAQSNKVNIETTDTFSTLTVSGTTKDNTGKYRVLAENKVGSDSAEFNVLVRDKPSKPLNLKVTDTDKTSITVTWQEPESDGGADITGYSIEKRDSTRPSWSTVDTVDSRTKKFKVGRLVEGNNYFIRVFAENSIGASEPAELSTPTTAKLPFDEPSAPRNLEAKDVTKESAKLVWEEPAKDGGSPIKGYIIEKRQAYSTRYVRLNKALVTRCSYNIDDLVHGDEYEFRVLAENEAGISKPSDTVGFKARAAYEKPGPPGQPDVEMSADTAKLKWSPPISDGRSKITNYFIEMKKEHDFRWSPVNQDVTVAKCQYTVTGLEEGEDYAFRVSAENAAGRGEPSGSSITARYEEEVTITKQLEDITFKSIPNTATFVCEVSKSKATVTWYKDGVVITPNKKYDITVDGAVHTLKVNDADGEDVGEYQVATKASRSKATLNIEAAPEFKLDSKFKDKLTMKAGASAVIEVPFSGSPQPKATWKWNDSSLPDTRRFKVDTIRNMTSISLARVERKDQGTLSLVLANKSGSVTLSVKLIILDKPSAPRNLDTSDVTENSIKLTWETPKDDGGSDITYYIIEKREASRRTWQPVATSMSCSCNAQKLIEGSTYVFRVAAENSCGVGEFTELATAVTARSPHGLPSPPSAPTVSDIFAKSCKLSWQPPANDGGTPIIGYYIERKSTASNRWVRVTSERVTDNKLKMKDLNAENQYEYRIIAENKVGCSEPGPACPSFIAKDPWGVPDAPGTPQPTEITDTSVTLNWSPPASDGGSPVTAYVVEFKAQSAFKWNTATDDTTRTSYTVKRLREDEVYDFRVSAENIAGRGEPAKCAQPIKAKTPIVGEPPEIVAPLKDTTVVAPGEITLECGVVLGKPKSEIHWYKDAREVYSGKKYEIDYAAKTASLVIKDTEPIDKGRYRCEVANALGRVDTSATLTVNIKPKLEFDARQTEMTVKAGASMILSTNFEGVPTPKVSWYINDKPMLQTPRLNIDSSDSYSTITLKNCDKKDSAVFKITVENSAGSDTAEFDVKIRDRPSPPSDLKVTEATQDSVSLSWNSPESDGGAPITGFVVEKRDSSRTTWTSVKTVESTSVTVKRLNEGTSYVFRVFAENTVGSSEPAELEKPVIAKLPFDAPSEPRKLVAENITNSSATLKWREPESDGGSKIKGYTIEKRQSYSTRWTRLNKYPIKETTHDLIDLSENTEYEFRVIAENEAGPGKSSESVAFKAQNPFDPPGAPGRPSVDITKGVANLKWTVPYDDGRSPITNYAVEMKKSGDLSWSTVEPKVIGTEFSVPNLKDETEYEFRVLAQNKAGLGDASQTSMLARYEELIEFKKELEDITLTRVPGTATFECELSKPDIALTWYKDGRPVRRDGKHHIEVDGKINRLTITDVDDDDVGEYAVAIKSKKSTATLKVQAKPRLLTDESFKEKLVLKSGTSAVIEVPFSGSPQPKVSWKFNSGSLPDARRIKVETIRNMTALTLSRVERSDSGEYTLKLSNEGGKVELNVKVIVLDKPQPPRGLSVTKVTESAINLEWREPSDDGGSPIRHYIVEKRESYKRTYIPVETTAYTECTASKLTEGQTYIFRVLAENECGVSEAIELSQGIVAKSPHGLPSAPSTPKISEIFKDSCVVSWQPPSTDGGTPVTGYVIERRTSANMRWVKATTEHVVDTKLKLSDLIEDKEYEVRVFAENKVGLSDPSSPSVPFTARDPWDRPGRPGQPKITEITGKSVSLSWSPPMSDGGSPVIGYMVEFRAQGAFKWNKASDDRITETSFTVKRLQENEEYEFRVSAENKGGFGPAAEVAQSVKAKEPIVGDPPKLKAKMNDVSVIAPKSITLECPMDLGKPKAEVQWFKNSREVYKSKKHQMSYSNGKSILVILDSEINDSGEYTCEARNQLGHCDSTASVEVNTQPKITFDWRLEGPQSVKAGSSLILSVTIAGIPVPELSWYQNDHLLDRTSKAYIEKGATYTTLTVKDTTKKDAGKYRIVAENKHGKDSAVFEVKINDKPAPPRNMHIKDTDRDSVTLAWSEPEDDGGHKVTGYIIEKRDAKRPTWTFAASVHASTTQEKVKNLLEDHDYNFRIFAENKIGTSEPFELKESVTAKLPFNPPGAPYGLEVDEITADSCRLSWTEPSKDGGSEITGFYIERRQPFSTRWVKVNKQPIRANHYKIGDLVEEQEYDFRVVAENAAGLGKPSDSTGTFKARRPYDVPGAPGMPDASISKDEATIVWSPPYDDGRSPITNYTLEMRVVGDFRWKTVNKDEVLTKTTYNMTGLKEGEEYEFRVFAENRAGHSEPSLISSAAKYEEQVEFTKRMTDVSVKEIGESATFDCEVSKANVPIQWLKDGQLLRSASNKYETIDDGKKHKLIIKNVDADDAGEYTVIAKHKRCSAALAVQAAPRCVMDKDYKDTIILRANNSMTIEVPFIAAPQPKVSWTVDNEVLMENRRVRTETIKGLTALSISRADRKDSGSYKVTLKNEYGDTSFNFKIVVIDKPTAPRNLDVANIGEEAITLQWDKPKDDGGCEIREYVIEKRETSRRIWQTAGSTQDNKFTVTRLAEGNYMFQVAAENQCGVGEFTEITEPVSPKAKYDVPDAPASPKVTEVYKDSCVITWRPPFNDGGAPVQGYHIERRATTSTNWVKASVDLIRDTKYIVTGLLDGTDYEVRVIAENRAGMSIPSEASNRFTAKDPWDKPGKPSVPRISEIKKKSVVLSWSAPEYDGGSVPFNYVIDYRIAGGFKWINANAGENVPDTTYKVMDLTEDQEYEFRVAAENKAGVGPPSEVTQPTIVKQRSKGKEPTVTQSLTNVTVEAPRSAILECRITPGEPAAEIRWFKNAREVYHSDKYYITYKDNVARLEIADTETTDAGKYRCEASNMMGRVDTKATLTMHTKPKLEYDQNMARKINTVKAGHSIIIQVNFTASPAAKVQWFHNEKPLEGSYRIGIDESDSFSMLSVRNTTKADTGVYRIVVENQVGSENAAFEFQVQDKPPAPASIRVSKILADSVDLEWEAPEGDCGDLKGYVIEKREASRNVWTTVSSVRERERNYTVDRLMEGTEYYFRVSAENHVGIGEPMELTRPVSAKCPYLVPEAPSGLKVESVSRRSITLSWKKPLDDGGAPIRGYILERITPGSYRWTKVSKTLIPETEYTITDVMEGNEYQFRVSAVNEAGASRYSDATNLIKAKDPFDKPDAPGQPDVYNITSDHATLRWSAPYSDGGSKITNYIIEMRLMGSFTWSQCNIGETVSNTTYIVPNLSKGMDYEFRVLAENKAGVSEPSQTSKRITAREPLVGDAPKVIEPLKKLSVLAGEMAKLHCKIIGKPTPSIRWSKNQMEVYETKRHEMVYENNFATLIIADASHRDEGTYLCEATNPLGYTSTEAQLSINIPPTLQFDSRMREGMTLRIDSTLTIRVRYEGAPKPKISWFRGSKELYDGGRVSIQTSDIYSTLTIQRAAKNDQGDYKVVARNAVGETNAVMPVTVLEKPEAPSDLKVIDIQRDSVSLEWRSPPSIDGAEINRYIIERRDRQGGNWAKVATVDSARTRHRVGNLYEGNDYIFRVFAENNIGSSEPLELDNYVKAKSPYTYPSEPVGPIEYSNITSSSVTLNWRPPINDGGSPVTFYIIEMLEDKYRTWYRTATVGGDQLKCKIQYLKEGDPYMFRVYAENVEGVSDPLTSRRPAIPRGSPEPPTTPPGTIRITNVGPTSFDIDWWAPPIDTNIKSYNIEIMDTRAGTWDKLKTVGKNTTRYSVSGLREGHEYQVRIAAVNEAGQSHFIESEPIQPSKPIVPPSRPTGGLRISEIYRDSVVIHWDHPEDDGGAPITSYQIEKRESWRPNWTKVSRVDAAETMYHISDLTEGNDYMFRVLGVNRAGFGIPLEVDRPILVASPFNKPSPPVGPIKLLSIDANSAEIEWQPPINDGGTPIQAYVIEGREANRLQWHKIAHTGPYITRHKVRNLLVGNEYNLRVKAINMEGESKPLQVEQTIIPRRKTEAPTTPMYIRLSQVTEDSATIEWRHPYDDGGSAITAFHIDVRPEDSDVWETVASVDPYISRYTVHGLREGVRYFFSVRAENEVGVSAHRQSDRPIIPTRQKFPPSMPRGPLKVVDVQKDSVKLSWTPPEADGGAPVTGYIVEVREFWSIFWTPVDRVSSGLCTYTMRDLIEGNDYYFRVLAENDVGLSHPLELGVAVTPASPFSTPYAPRGPITYNNIDKTVVDIAWQPPREDGGKPITKYHIERRDRTRVNWVPVATVPRSQHELRVTNLIEGSEYIFRICAENEEGKGEYLANHEPIVSRRPPEVPGPPSGLKAFRVTPNNVSLSWNISTEDGGSRILGYYIEQRSHGSQEWIRVGRVGPYTSMYTVPNLRNGQQYQFRVCAINDCGLSEPYTMEKPVQATRPDEPPYAPVGPLETRIFKETVVMKWHPPKIEGGAPITGYVVEKHDTQIPGWIVESQLPRDTYEYRFNTLTKGHHYFLRVAALNKYGTGRYLEMTDTVLVESPYSKPGAPSFFEVTNILADSVSLQWTPPRDDGGAPITRYVIEMHDKHSRIWKPAGSVEGLTSYTVPHLREGKTYFFRVIAENQEGLGVPLELHEAVRPLSPTAIPGPPSSFDSIAKTKNSVTLSWQRPSQRSSASLTHYIIEYKDAKGGTWFKAAEVEPHTHTYTVHDLIEGWEYNFRVIAVNKWGASEPKDLEHTVHPRKPPGPPTAPLLLEVRNITENSITLTWQRPIHDGGCPVESYVVEQYDLRGNTWSVVENIERIGGDAGILDRVCHIPGLKENKRYWFRIMAKNAMGLSPPLETEDPVIPKSPYSAPDEPDGPLRAMKVTRETVTLQWHPPINDGGSPVLRYIVEGRIVGEREWRKLGETEANVTTYSVQGLNENSQYYFHVMAENHYGVSEPLDTKDPIIPRRLLEQAPAFGIYDDAHASSAQPTEHVQRGDFLFPHNGVGEPEKSTVWDEIDSGWLHSQFTEGVTETEDEHHHHQRKCKHSTWKYHYRYCAYESIPYWQRGGDKK